MEIEALAEEYAVLFDEVKAREARMAAIREMLESMVDYRRRKFESGRVTVTYARSYRLVQWDKNELQALARKHPDILAARSEKYVKPRRSIKVR